MRINTNIAALNSYNQLKNTQNNLSKSLQRLSSGKRINGAADDAAGLAISEKMKAQINGLGQAQRNAQDGISMIQTAEGALKESHAILQRMRELAVQSANDTNTEADREEIQKEVDQLSGELSRISNTTEFNTQTLLNGAIQEGTNGEAVFQIGANKGQNLSIGINAMDASSLGVAEDVASVSAKVDTTTPIKAADIDGSAHVQEGTYSIEFDSATTDAYLKDEDGNTLATATYADSTAEELTFSTDDGDVTISKDGSAVSGSSYDVNIGASGSDLSESTNTVGLAGVQMNNSEALSEGTYTITYDATAGSESTTLKDSSGEVVDTVSGVLAASGTVDFTVDGETITATVGSGGPTAGDSEFTVTHSDYESGTSEAATDSDGDGKIDTDAKVAKGIDVRTQANADKAIAVLDEALANVSSERSKLGALQNRLDHTINNLNTSQENLTAAESRISDVDMAREMMSFTKNQILSQAGTAMLAQANQLPQGVLQLLG
ncbi:MAG: flagellin [Halanaerobiales bacterium]|nr:flagellin [Halanaerobiales bacterium]